MSAQEPPLHVVLYNPEITTPGTSAGCRGLVRPCMVPDRVLHGRKGRRRWVILKHVDLHEHENGDAFWSWAAERRVPFSTKGSMAYTQATFAHGDVLVFGCETKGLPEHLVRLHGALRIPVRPDVRSLNLSNAVAIVTYAAMASIGPPDFV